MDMGNAQTQGKIYLLWGEYTTSFKIGYTNGSVSKRAMVIENCSAVPLRVLAAIPGTMQDERIMHAQLRQFRTHGEWFNLPEEVAWKVFDWFGITETSYD